MKRNPAGAGQMDFLRSRQSFSTTPALQSPAQMVKLKQLSTVSVQHAAPSLVFGMLHTIARRDTMLRDYRSADIHGLGLRSGPTGGDLAGGDKPHKRSNKVYRDQANPKQFD